MTLSPQPSLRTAQHLILAPQLQQSIRLLQLSSFELAEEVERALTDNPFLERPEDAIAALPRAAPDRASPAELEQHAPTSTQDDGAAPDSTPAEAAGGDDWLDGLPAPEAAGSAADGWPDASAPESLAEHLQRQVMELRLPAEDAAALRFLIGSLDEDGYLPDTLAELAATLVEDGDDMDQLHALVLCLQRALRQLQALDPPGVGARGLAQCLALQLQRRLGTEPPGSRHAPVLQAALSVCNHPEGLAWLAAGDVGAMAAALASDARAARRAAQLVATLEPKPGRRFADVRQQLIVPDVQVRMHGVGARLRLEVRLTRRGAPALQVNAQYAHALSQTDATHAPALLKALEEARWLVQSLQQRAHTILRVATAIVHHQQPFLEHGELAMRPLTQAEVAAQLQLHESTVSRATAGKYMATPRGTYELKFFFASAVATQGGGQASNTAVKALIRQLVAQEDPGQPLSDARLSALLQDRGIDCARRTVAKYRDALRIPSARQRRR